MLSEEVPLEALRARERGRRLLLFGLIGMIYAGGWLFLSWRATRVGRGECEVVRVNSDYCTVRHFVDGKEHTLPWDDCFEPTRWPMPAPGPAVVGARMKCYYYRNFPSSIFFEPRDERWLGPTPAVALLGAFGMFVAGVSFMARRRGGRHRRVQQDSAYRSAALPDNPPATPLSFAQPMDGWERPILGAVALPSAIGLATLFTWLAAEETREIGLIGVIALIFHGMAIAIAIAVFRRSSVTIDPARRLLVRGWGLVWPFFFDYRSLDEVRASIAPGSLGPARLLVLDLGHGEQDVYPLTGAEEQAARAIEGLLAPEPTLES